MSYSSPATEYHYPQKQLRIVLAVSFVAAASVGANKHHPSLSALISPVSIWRTPVQIINLLWVACFFQTIDTKVLSIIRCWMNGAILLIDGLELSTMWNAAFEADFLEEKLAFK